MYSGMLMGVGAPLLPSPPMYKPFRDGRDDSDADGGNSNRGVGSGNVKNDVVEAVPAACGVNTRACARLLPVG